MPNLPDALGGVEGDAPIALQPVEAVSAGVTNGPANFAVGRTDLSTSHDGKSVFRTLDKFASLFRGQRFIPVASKFEGVRLFRRGQVHPLIFGGAALNI